MPNDDLANVESLFVAAKNTFEPFTWKYFDEYSRGIFQYRSQDSLSIQTSVGKILYDTSRPYDPIYNENQVPYILMELYQYESNEDAKSFVDKYPRVYNAFFGHFSPAFNASGLRGQAPSGGHGELPPLRAHGALLVPPQTPEQCFRQVE